MPEPIPNRVIRLRCKLGRYLTDCSFLFLFPVLFCVCHIDCNKTQCQAQFWSTDEWIWIFECKSVIAGSWNKVRNTHNRGEGFHFNSCWEKQDNKINHGNKYSAVSAVLKQKIYIATFCSVVCSKTCGFTEVFTLCVTCKIALLLQEYMLSKTCYISRQENKALFQSNVQ